MGSAVDEENIRQELGRYARAGLGGVHIIPIYQARGWEEQAIPYLSPRWLDVLDFTVRVAEQMGLGVDMTTGTGWCFGGPEVTAVEANAKVTAEVWEVTEGKLPEGLWSRENWQALRAFGPGGRQVDLAGLARPDGEWEWQAEGGPWTVYGVSQKPSGQMVKRAAPGGEGPMLNLFYGPGMSRYLEWMDVGFAGYRGARPRAQYHDSYEYRSDWAPDFFARFQERRGYDLREELPALLGGAAAAGWEPDRVARVKGDWRATVSDLMVEVTLPQWVAWCRKRGFQTRNEAHGSPGNWLDLYALADMPETEMFARDRSKLIAKFASSAAHVAGRQRVSSETGTWLKEHFTVTLADLKYLLDDLFLSGVNHVFYHGTCYSPEEAGWPGWVFYASTQMNPRNPIWRDAEALNAYAARCQAVLRAGQPDNDLLVYWPIHDLWHEAEGGVEKLTVHTRDWFEGQPVGGVAEWLWHHGYAFDYVSDRQLGEASVVDGRVKMPGAIYRAVVVPPCEHMPLETAQALLNLARAGATVIFVGERPGDVPGWGQLAARREAWRELWAGVAEGNPEQGGVEATGVGSGRLLTGDLAAALAQAGMPREAWFDGRGLMGIRREVEDGWFYFLANRGEEAWTGWLQPARAGRGSVVMMDPMNGKTGLARVRREAGGGQEVFLDLAPGASMVWKIFRERRVEAEPWRGWRPAGEAVELTGDWRVEFLAGGPNQPEPRRAERAFPWTALGGEEMEAFAGTARYVLEFAAPGEGAGPWLLDLGRVAQSARVRLNGKDLGTLICPPYAVVVDELRRGGNRLEVEVTSVAANRIRDLDRRGVPWRNFHDINFVNIDYKPFDASGWPVAEAGLPGPVTLSRAETRAP